ncbi:MAG: sigma-70 family RNA polymerase sigma factor [Eubacterium sp.]|nr:sigma-70 family RNA polymerase sigma factor [Eubacterium sp.]
MKANETNFITLLRKRKEEGILYVIDTYGGYLRAIVARRLTALPDQVDECMNDIFLGIWNHIGSFDEAKGSFKNWAAGIARLESIDRLRRAGRKLQTVSLDALELVQEDAGILELVEKELTEETRRLLSCLDQKDQELFFRIYVEEEDPRQVSREMGMTRGNLYVRLNRGKKKMRLLAEKGRGM